MPFVKLKLNPGITTNTTPVLNEAGWSGGNLLRWKGALLERVGGWQRLFSGTCAGFVRALHAYEDLNLVNTLLLGTDGGFQIFANGSIATATIAKTTRSLTIPWLSSTAGSPVLQVTDPGHGASAGDKMSVPTNYTVGRGSNNALYLPAGTYTIASVIDANTYTINPGIGPASFTESGGWPVQYSIAANSSIITANAGYRIWNVGDTYTVLQSTTFPNTNVTLFGKYTVLTSTGYTITFDCKQMSAQQMAIYEGGTDTGSGTVSYFAKPPPTPQNWFVDNLGQNGVINFTNGPIYLYTPPFSNSVVINIIASAPQINSGVFVAMPQAQIIAFGSEATIGGGVQDPLLIRWCNVGDPNNWIAGGAIASQAGSFRLSKGSRVIGGIQAPQSSLLWTDTDVWSMVYTGGQFVYSFTIVGSGCGLIAPKARAVQGRNTYWMGQKTFWAYGDNGVQPIECPVWDQVFPLIDQANVRKCFAASNSSFHEVAFFYPVIGGSGECEAYVKLNTITGLWDYGRLTRTAWIDESVFGSAMGADGNMRVQQHEIGYDADDQPMTGAYALSGLASMSDGTQFTFIDRIIPDLKWLGARGSVNVTVYTADHPGDMPVMHGPYSITALTPEVALRARARFMAVRFDWMPSSGYSARMGAPMIRTAPAGRR